MAGRLSVGGSEAYGNVEVGGDGIRGRRVFDEKIRPHARYQNSIPAERAVDEVLLGVVCRPVEAARPIRVSDAVRYSVEPGCEAE